MWKLDPAGFTPAAISTFEDRAQARIREMRLIHDMKMKEKKNLAKKRNDSQRG